jgi:CBS domain containing-hemolysin-like protein
MSTGWSFVVALLLLAFNALFVAAEFALISARRTQLEPAAQAGSRMARLAVRSLENIAPAIAAVQLGVTTCSLGLGAVGEPAIAITIVGMTHVVLGEMVPKNLALVGPDRAVLYLGPFMLGFIAVLRPLVAVLNRTATLAVRALQIEPKDEVSSTFTHDEVAGLVEESRREGLLDKDEYDLVSGALDFHDGKVEQVLLPIDGLITIEPSATPVEVERACAATGFSRFPVSDASGALTGYLHIKDVLETDETTRAIPIADKWVRPLATVVVGSGLYDALRTMQARGSHMARVAEQDGTVRGVIMLEDVLEELVGEIREAGV